jgi:hypothetical protein
VRPEVERSMKQSARQFLEIVVPHIKGILGGGTIVPVETIEAADGSMRFALDVYSGIDAFHLVDQGSLVRGIASRCQPYGSNWRTHTIRRELWNGGETEWHKRCRALEGRGDGWLLPHLWVQAYLRDEEFLGAAVCRTADLFAFARSRDDAAPVLTRHDPTIVYKRRVQGGNTMLVVPWQCMEAAGFENTVVDPPPRRDAAIGRAPYSQPGSQQGELF